MVLAIDLTQLGCSHSGSPTWLPWDGGDTGVISKASSFTCLVLGLGKFQRLGLKHLGLFWLSLSSRDLSMWSLQHGGFRAVELLITCLLRAPQAYVLSERTRQKLYHLLRSSLESHIVLLLLYSPPKKTTQVQRQGTKTPSLDLGEEAAFLKEHVRLNIFLQPLFKNIICHKKFNTILSNW